MGKERHARSRRGAEWLERAEVCRDAQRDFLADHFAWWVPAFARALAERTRALDPPPRLAAALSSALAALVPVERALLGVQPPDELARPLSDREEPQLDCAGCSASDGS